MTIHLAPTLAAFLVLGQAGQPTPHATTTQHAPAQPATKGTERFKTADELLTALETANSDLRTLTCTITWRKEFFLGGDAHLRKGTLDFVDSVVAPAKPRAAGDAKPAAAPVPSTRKFSITIDETIVIAENNPKGDRLDRAREQYIFDGTALVEKRPDQKLLIRHALNNKAGADPLKIGQGPIPLPIGQKREDILARFVVELLPAEQDLAPSGEAIPDDLKVLVKDSDQLKLVPRPEFEKECSFKEARLWYKRTQGPGPSLLPRMARAIDKQDNTDLVQLIGIRTNVTIDAAFDTSVPQGWVEQKR